MLEKHMNKGELPGKGPFVAAFASTNLGDVSPNLKGPHCIDTGEPCDLEHSTCNGRNQLCMAAGPGNSFKILAVVHAIRYIEITVLRFVQIHAFYHAHIFIS